jgi:hypothetical protein
MGRAIGFGREQGDWIEWPGGKRPVGAEVRVQVRMRHLLYPGDRRGAEIRGVFVAGDIEGWYHEGNAGDIIAYRIVGSPSP